LKIKAGYLELKATQKKKTVSQRQKYTLKMGRACLGLKSGLKLETVCNGLSIHREWRIYVKESKVTLQMKAAYSFESWNALTSSSVTTQKNYKVNTPQETFKYCKQKFFFRSVVQLLLYYLSHTKKTEYINS
jgi:hypothetical protein